MTIQNELKKIDEMIEARDKATKVFHSNMKHMTDYLCGKDEGGDFVIADFNRGMPNWKNDIEFCLLSANNIKQLLENYKAALKVIEFYARHENWEVSAIDDLCTVKTKLSKDKEAFGEALEAGLASKLTYYGGNRARKFIEDLNGK